MKRGMKNQLTIWMALFGSSMAFCPSSSTTHQQQQKMALHLVPGQGNQLAAAFSAACSKGKHEDDFRKPVATEVPDASATTDKENPALNFMQRAFHFPNVIRRQPVHPKDQLMIEQKFERNKDVVLFPLVGFTFCKNGDRVVPLPTKSNVCCRLPARLEQEELYGW
eukprot:CAMPEP_0176004070 /NCGR_PEP_ID=MMETSP0120_2-20121206/1501_1 /TAXON_ID=160619 /ORGANISM="Kryptoperidinium foliaceum, Strain CCMP 1326" /LENGTH=165 /DNA_ID=CAMNT_0017336735 /DNA_START=111 /DNA_END=606 /DNA_ORIENTATION=-